MHDVGKVSVFGLSVRVVQIAGDDGAKLGEEDLGAYFAADACIYIRSGLPADLREAVFRHEYGHAFLFLTGLQELILAVADAKPGNQWGPNWQRKEEPQATCMGEAIWRTFGGPPWLEFKGWEADKS